MWVPDDDWMRHVQSAGLGLVVVATGGGSQAISALLSAPGASRCMVEGVAPYAPAALADWLGAPPREYCSSRTARAMAMVAWQRAVRLGGEGRRPAGVACTASLASDRPKLGPHRIHAARQTLEETVAVSIELEKGLRTRAEEERLAAALILKLVGDAAGAATPVLESLPAGDRVQTQSMTGLPEWRELLSGAQLVVSVRPGDGPPRTGSLIFPGAFDPRHTGHLRMAELAATRHGGEVEWELSIENVDKPLLDYVELRDRREQFSAGEPLWLTRAPTFLEKALLFPIATFVVGADTLLRIADPKYYGGDPAARSQACRQLAATGCKFLMFARRVSGKVLSLEALDLPPDLRAICEEAPAGEFLDEISSTQLRSDASPKR